jgi:hypothetical protein
VNLAYRRFDIGWSHSSLCFDSRNFLFGEFECRKRRKSELSPTASAVNVVRRSRLTAATGLSGNESAAIVSAEGIPGFRNAVACWAYEIADPGRFLYDRSLYQFSYPTMASAPALMVCARFMVTRHTHFRKTWHQIYLCAFLRLLQVRQYLLPLAVILRFSPHIACPDLQCVQGGELRCLPFVTQSRILSVCVPIKRCFGLKQAGLSQRWRTWRSDSKSNFK